MILRTTVPLLSQLLVTPEDRFRLGSPLASSSVESSTIPEERADLPDSGDLTVDKSLLSHRKHRHALSQLVAGGSFASSVPTSTSSTFAGQAEGLTTLRVFDEAETPALDPLMHG
jgi:hypothetical protein